MVDPVFAKTTKTRNGEPLHPHRAAIGCGSIGGWAPSNKPEKLRQLPPISQSLFQNARIFTDTVQHLEMLSLKLIALLLRHPFFRQQTPAVNDFFSFEIPATIQPLLSEAAFSNYALTPGNQTVRSTLTGLSAGDLFPRGIKDEPMAQCCLSGIWLLHNFLNESHEISQSIHSREGSYWHGIMHRLEGDYWNSKYWFRKTGNHPCLEHVLGTHSWNPSDFTDQCESHAEQNEQLSPALQEIAAAEWRALFDYCYTNASHD